MHTPGHAVVNLAAIGSATDASLAAPILAGAILPDLPIIALYLRERWLHHTPEEQIWRDHYQRPFWQNLIHGLHSLPLALAGLLAALALESPSATVFFASALLHACSDLPVHHEDAHRHFFPLSNYRFISPLSYWDVRHHGRWVALAELLLVYACSALLFARTGDTGPRILLGVVVGWYAVNYWRSFLRPARHPSA